MLCSRMRLPYSPVQRWELFHSLEKKFFGTPSPWLGLVTINELTLSAPWMSWLPKQCVFCLVAFQHRKTKQSPRFWKTCWCDLSKLSMNTGSRAFRLGDGAERSEKHAIQLSSIPTQWSCRGQKKQGWFISILKMSLVHLSFRDNWTCLACHEGLATCVLVSLLSLSHSYTRGHARTRTPQRDHMLPAQQPGVLS